MIDFQHSCFDGPKLIKSSTLSLFADILNEERWEVDEISDRIFRRIIGRKSASPIDSMKERKLFLRYKSGDMKARDLLVFANLRLVKSIARQFKPHKLTCNDLISDGLIGLLKAIDGYKVDMGARFSTYAAKTIYYHIISSLNIYNSSILFPSSISSLISKYNNYCISFFQEYSSYPSDYDAANELKITIYQAKGLRQCLVEPVSIEHLCELFGRKNILEDLLEDIIDCEHETFDTELNHISLILDIDDVLSELNDREADIIKKSFGIGCYPFSLEELGILYDISRERVRQIREKALKKMKGKLGQPLRKYLG